MKKDIHSAIQAVKYVAILDFLHQKEDIQPEPKASEMFKNVAKGFRKNDVTSIAEDYLKQYYKLMESKNNSLSKVAVFQAREEYDKSKVNPENYELIYVENYPDSKDIPDNEKLIKRFKDINKLDNYFGHPLRRGDIVVIYNQDAQKAETLYYNGRQLTRFEDNFLTQGMMNKLLTNFHVEAEEFIYSAIKHHEDLGNLKVLPKELDERHSQIRKEYGEAFLINKLMSKEIREFDYNNCYSLSYRKVVDYNDFTLGRDINNFNDTVLTKKAFPIDAKDPKETGSKPVTRGQWKKAIQTMKKEKQLQDMSKETNKAKSQKVR
ncbi:MAG TPA: YodL domain-containing protein [Defluviitaleaceae bacterium]|nr:YodL domain-containing protein [Defluviitaleaceae bacterium]HPT76556.1 YodL domain-containing protein [Defluviitaleaceae bacterium]